MKFFQSSSFRVAAVFVGGMLILFSILAFVVAQQGERSFQASIRDIQVVQRLDQQGRIILEPIPSILDQHVRNEKGKLQTPGEYFASKFRTSILWISLMALGVALILGVLITEYFLVKPLSRLQSAISNLRTKKGATQIEPTGLPEFDQVADSFNDLANELVRAESLRRDLISDTSHEIKTPLTSLRAQLEGMRDGLVPMDNKRVELLLAHVGRLSDLTERLQDYARMRNRTMSLDKKPVALLSLVQKVLQLESDRISTAELSVKVDIDKNVTVNIDETLFEQVLVNLITNAAHYAKGTKVIIKFKENALTISDTGKGVPEEALPNIFERFYRVDASRNRKSGGLGLGLAIVREIVDAHGYTIEASKNKPTGLAISISFPPQAISEVQPLPSASHGRERGQKSGEPKGRRDSSRASKL